jgi:DNA-binding CsgD family transcriptional regulator
MTRRITWSDSAKRARVVHELYASGLTETQIGKRLGISRHSVSWYRRSLKYAHLRNASHALQPEAKS